MVFGWFNKKKKEEEDEPLYDPTNIQLNQLKKGSFIDYDFKTWEVREVYEYDWGDDFFTDEYKLSTAEDTVFLHVEEDDGLECTLTRKINIHDIDGDIPDHILENETPPMKVTYQGETFYRKGEGVGYFRNTDNDNWYELVSWSYYDKEGKKILAIEQWGEEEFEAAYGIIANEYEFSNIIMP